MKDLLIAGIVFASLPFIFKSPRVGVLMWVWISIMNPHKLTYGFAYSFPFAAIIAGVTLVSLVTSREQKSFPFNGVTVCMLLFFIWMSITTLAAIYPESAYTIWEKVSKTFLFLFITLMVMRSKKDIELLVWLLAFSVGFFGIKGGIFTVMTGGQYKVWGPPGSYIEDNNALALAVTMTIPLFNYLRGRVQNKWLQRGFLAAMVLCGFAALGTYSRGGLLAMAAMSLFLWTKSSRKLVFGSGMVLVGALLLVFMPDKWNDRMNTIQTYQEDGSALGRLNAWQMAFNLANDRPIGGGFDIWTPELFYMYSPDPNRVHAAHSIYFAALGEHGYPGLLLYLAIFFLSWRTAARIVKQASRYRELEWVKQLAVALQISMIGFAVGGAFLSLLYWDYQYYQFVLLVLLERYLQNWQPGQADEPFFAKTKRPNVLHGR